IPFGYTGRHLVGSESLGGVVADTQLNTQSKPIDTWLKRISTVVAVIVSIVGGLWAYSRYIAEDLPALALRAKMDGNVLWYERSGSDKECIAEFKVKLENIGKSTMKLTEATVGAWPLKLPVAGEPIAYVDPKKQIEGVAPLANEENILGNYLRQYYPPG